MIAAVVAALSLPAESRVDRRVPKKLLAENGAPTAADKRQIIDGVQELIWLAALKPATIGVPIFRDDTREYLEIAVLSLTLSAGAKATRLTELIHRAIPYPVFLIQSQPDVVTLSLSHLRWSQGQSVQTVLDGRLITATVDSESPVTDAFLASLQVASLPGQHLYALYQGWVERFEAHAAAAQITGRFSPPDSDGRAQALRDGLDARVGLQRELTALRAQAEKEKQLNRRVELNLEIKRLEAELAATEQDPLRTKQDEETHRRRPGNQIPRHRRGQCRALKALFPEAFTEGKIDFEVLKQLLGGTVDERKRSTASTGTASAASAPACAHAVHRHAAPLPEESVDWETHAEPHDRGRQPRSAQAPAEESYAGKVKLIYIDPPYNTGKDFVYPDNFQDNIKNYLELTGQTGEGGQKISSNTEASGRFHTDWLNMMYPRLKLARNLLREDGVIFISIDDNEVDTS
jgi:hypothetical protein